MITELRENLDIIIVIIAALLIYHLYLKSKGVSSGIAK